MSRVHNVQQQIAQLDAAEFRALRDWLAEYEADLWDRQLEADAANGTLDRIAEHALREHEAGRTAPL